MIIGFTCSAADDAFAEYWREDPIVYAPPMLLNGACWHSDETTSATGSANSCRFFSLPRFLQLLAPANPQTPHAPGQAKIIGQRPVSLQRITFLFLSWQAWQYRSGLPMSLRGSCREPCLWHMGNIIMQDSHQRGKLVDLGETARP